MLITIAWRNIWRNPLRSAVVMTSIALGLMAGTFLLAFSWGMNEQRTREIIETQVSHLQVHHPNFRADNDVADFIPESRSVLSMAKQNQQVKAATGRLLVGGMVASAKGNTGVQIRGITPDAEHEVTQLRDRIIEGEYFTARRNPIIISQKTAERLKVGLRKKVVLTFQRPDGEITAGAFRVNGIYQTTNPKYDEAHVFVRLNDLDRLLGSAGKLHEVAILMKDIELLPQVKTDLTAEFPEAAIEDWMELSPDLRLIAESFGVSMRIFIGVILLALAFGIINTMLMAVLERRRELGMLMSIGMNRKRLFGMVMLETAMLTLIGSPIGLGVAWLLIAFFGKVGISLSAVSDGLSSMGFSDRVYTSLETTYYIETAIMVVITAIIASIYPAIKAIKLNPVEAMRAV
ncbi:MAG: FtsX-like permease family protein [Bacteroidota bacterium]